MKRYTKNYLDFFHYGIDDWIPCELCGSQAVDCHHLTKQSKFGKKKEKDYIENIIAVCRDCHNKCEQDDLFNCYARIKHLETVCSQIYAMISLKKKLKNYGN